MACAVPGPREPSRPCPPPGPLPPSQPADEVMPEPSGGGGLGPCGRGCVAGRERVAEGREPRQLSPNWGVRVNAPLETRSQKRREFVYRPALQAGGGEESPVPAEAHLEPPEHLAELSQEPRTSHLWGLRCFHPLTVRGRSGPARRGSRSHPERLYPILPTSNITRLAGSPERRPQRSRSPSQSSSGSGPSRGAARPRSASQVKP